MTSPPQPSIRTRWPPYLTAGATFKINRAFADYGTGDWNYSLLFAGAQVANFSQGQITVSDAQTFSVTLAPVDTQKLNPSGAASAPYTYVERLTAVSDGEIVDVCSGRIMVEPNLALAAAGDALSFEEKTLLVLEAAVQGRLTSDIENYSIAGRSVSKIPARELLQLRGQFKAIVWRQRNPGRITQSIDVTLRSSEAGRMPGYWPGFDA
jgi:hypothetical protein